MRVKSWITSIWFSTGTYVIFFSFMLKVLFKKVLDRFLKILKF